MSVQLDYLCCSRLYGPSHEIMVIFVLRKLILQVSMRNHPVGLDVWCLVGPLVYFHTSCLRTEKPCSGETARMRRLAWAFAGRLCDKYHNLMRWLILICVFSILVLVFYENHLKFLSILTGCSQFLPIYYKSHWAPVNQTTNHRSCGLGKQFVLSWIQISPWFGNFHLSSQGMLTNAQWQQDIWQDEHTLSIFNMSRAMRKCVLCHMRTTKAQISLRIRAVWSAPLLFAA